MSRIFSGIPTFVKSLAKAALNGPRISRILARAASLLFSSCSRPDGTVAQRIHQLLQEGKIQQAQESLQEGFRQFPDSTDLRQERLHLNLLAGQPELAAAEARQILQAKPSAQPYRLPLSDSSPAIRSLALRAFALDPPDHPSPLGILRNALKDIDPTVRREAVEASRILSTPEALPLLREASKDSDWLTRSISARLLGSRNDFSSGLPDQIRTTTGKRISANNGS
jgi:HEAT repeat protein